MNQIFALLKLLGFSRAIKMKQRHDEANPILRGYVTTNAVWALLNTGIMDELIQGAVLDPKTAAEKKHLSEEVLEALFHYLFCVDILAKQGKAYVLGPKGKRLMEEPKGSFHLLYGYEPIFKQLQEMLKNEKVYGKDILRRDEFVARGSGELCEQLPYQVMRQMIQEAGINKVLDLGCGNGQFLAHLASHLDAAYEGFGIDISKEAVDEAHSHLQSLGLKDKIRVEQADMFQLKQFPQGWPEIEVITAIDVFHEYLYTGNERIAGLFKQFKQYFPNTALLVGEFCEQTEERLKSIGSSFVEHHFFHALSKQRIVPAEVWRQMFHDAGYKIEKEQVFDLVGHGYFLLR